MKCHVHQDREAVGQCVDCGRVLCADCSRERDGKVRCEVHDAAAVAIPPATPITPFTGAPAQRTKPYSSAAAFWLSFCPGGGHLYLGLYQRGITFFLIVVGLMTIGVNANLPLFGVGATFAWLFSAIDARRCAIALNTGALQTAGMQDPELKELWKKVAIARARGTSSLMWGIILVGVGTLALFNQYFDMETFWDFIEKNWPAALIVLGLVLIISHARGKKKGEESAEPSGPTQNP